MNGSNTRRFRYLPLRQSDSSALCADKVKGRNDMNSKSSFAFLLSISMLSLGLVPLLGITRSVAQANVMITPGATPNLNLLSTPPMTPTCGGKVRSADSGNLQSVINAAQPGDVVELTSGIYSGAFTIANQATDTCQITIRPASYSGMASANNGVTFDNCGGQRSAGTNACLYLNGRFVNVVGMKFGANTRAATVELDGYKQRLWGNRWLSGAGDGEVMNCCPLVLAQADITKPYWWTTLRPTMVDRYNRIEGNTVETQTNGFYSQGHGVVGNVIGWNTLTGPPAINAAAGTVAETEAIKIGGAFANECTNTFIQFNTILNWDGSPYTIGNKGSCITTAYNYLQTGKITLRIADNNAVVGNQLDDGTLVLTGHGHVVRNNVVRTSTMGANYGPVIMYGQIDAMLANKGQGHCNYDGVSLPISAPQEGLPCPHYVKQFDNSTLSDNVFVDASPTAYSVINTTGGDPSPPSNINWSNNKFIRMCPGAGPGAFSGGAVDAQKLGKWTNNVFAYFPTTCGVASAHVLGSGGNNTSLGSWTPTDPVQVRYEAQFTNVLTAPATSGGSAPAPAPRQTTPPSTSVASSVAKPTTNAPTTNAPPTNAPPTNAPTTSAAPMPTTASIASAPKVNFGVVEQGCELQWPVIEAECASLTGGFEVETSASASGGKVLGAWDYGGTATLVVTAPSSKTYTLSLSATAPYGPATRTVSVNGVERKFAVSSVAPETVEIPGVTLQAGVNTIVFSRQSGNDYVVNLDRIVFK
jgi:hypothetical protein